MCLSDRYQMNNPYLQSPKVDGLKNSTLYEHMNQKIESFKQQNCLVQKKYSRLLPRSHVAKKNHCRVSKAVVLIEHGQSLSFTTTSNRKVFVVQSSSIT